MARKKAEMEVKKDVANSQDEMAAEMAAMEELKDIKIVTEPAHKEVENGEVRHATKILNLLTAEGYQGQQKKTFDKEPWMEIYAARQNNLVIQDIPTAIEKHTIRVKKDGEYKDMEMSCLVVMLGGMVKGLIPLPEAGIMEDKEVNARQAMGRMRGLVGQLIAFKVKAIDRENNLCILSRKDALAHMAAITWKEIREGDIRTVVVRSVMPDMIIVNLGGIETPIPAPELSWGWVKDARDMFAVGDTFDVLVKMVDTENKRLMLSLKALLPDAWMNVPDKYIVRGEYTGTITGIEEYGMFVNLESGVDAVIKLPKSERVRSQMKVGNRALIRIREIIPEKRRIKADLIKIIYV